MKDMGIFFAVFMIELFGFACVGLLMFGKLKEYKSLYRTVIMLFETSMGNWDLKIYKPLGNKAFVGEMFHTVFILLNLLMLLNLVIAIMADTFNQMVAYKKGLYYDGVIEAMPIFKHDKRYGALISTVPPFNILVVPLLPFFLGTNNDKFL
jgi:hypothetical protein